MKNGVHSKVKVSSCRTCASAKTRAVDYIAKRDFPFIDNSLLEQCQNKRIAMRQMVSSKKGKPSLMF